MRKINTIKFLLLVIVSILSCKTSDKISQVEQKKEEGISIEYPEVYELANIALALTEYGITDKWQVRKDFAYYVEIQENFKEFQNHPLIDSINFSRERWQEYLSYRTDSYAFIFDENDKLKRRNGFQSFEIKTFDKYLSLTEDFAIKSNFRKFFSEHKTYYSTIVDTYKKEYLLPEMKSFLSQEFENYFGNKKYSVVISPFVYAQNLHRDIDSTWTADFPAIAKTIIEGQPFENKEDKSTEIHTLFTEMNHGYINPTTDKFDVENKFNEKLWDDESGYAGGGNAVFNEYMTWAVFDIFNSIHFPEFDNKVNLNWHFQNDTRGFIYSNFLASKLKELYYKYEGKKKVKDLYPEILDWTQKIQSTLSKPLLLNDSDTLQVQAQNNLIKLEFSEPMKKVKKFDIVLQFSQWETKVVKIGYTNKLDWDAEGKLLSFEIKLPQKDEYYLLLNWWGVESPLISKKGIMLKATSGLIVKGNSAQNKG